ncbi:hypothetical protein VNO77_17862 [Canavalia gladiata]|uniref:Uncharacterized protein n=1 Tax=Canavalia gladiata TaxID=3824 RepID=A0AAN9QJR2_CANGL
MTPKDSMSDSNNGAATIVQRESPTLRRRNSITATSAATPNKLSLPATGSEHSSSLELISLKSPFSSYTSLRDVLPSPNVAINSPTASGITGSGYEISIRNRLVKQAAWAYLQPMSNSPSSSSSPHFLRRLPTACFSFLVPVVARFFRRLLNALRGCVSTPCYP